MIATTPNTKKPPRRLPPAEGVIPTPARETKMLNTLHLTADTGEQPDWRVLLDDPEVLRIVRQAACANRGPDPLLNDDLESYLTSAAVNAAHRFIATRGEATIDRDHWYAFLSAALKLEARGHYKAIYGHPGSARRAATVVSAQALMESIPWAEAGMHPIVSNHEGPNPGDSDLQGALRKVGTTAPVFTVDDVLTEAPLSNYRTVVETIRQSIKKGRVTRVRHSGPGRPALYSLASAEVAA